MSVACSDGGGEGEHGLMGVRFLFRRFLKPSVSLESRLLGVSFAMVRTTCV